MKYRMGLGVEEKEDKKSNNNNKIIIKISKNKTVFMMISHTIFQAWFKDTDPVKQAQDMLILHTG